MTNMSTMAIDYGCVFQAFSHILPAPPHKVDGQKSTMTMRMSPICHHANYAYATQDWSVC